MTQTIRVPKPRDPLSGMIASYRSAYARKWRVPVPQVEEPADRAPAASVGETDAFEQVIRKLLFCKGGH